MCVYIYIYICIHDGRTSPDLARPTATKAHSWARTRERAQLVNVVFLLFPVPPFALSQPK